MLRHGDFCRGLLSVRSVCFDAPTKWDGVSFQPMSTWNISNGKPRRTAGIDKRGSVYILADLERYQRHEFPSTNQIILKVWSVSLI